MQIVRLLGPGPPLDDSVFRHDDDAASNEEAVAVELLNEPFVDQPHAVADAGVLVDEDAFEHDVAADTERGPPVGIRDFVIIFVEVGAEENRAPDDGSGLNRRADADDRFPDRTVIEAAALREGDVAHGALAQSRRWQEARMG